MAGRKGRGRSNKVNKKVIEGQSENEDQMPSNNKSKQSDRKRKIDGNEDSKKKEMGKRSKRRDKTCLDDSRNQEVDDFVEINPDETEQAAKIAFDEDNNVNEYEVTGNASDQDDHVDSDRDSESESDGSQEVSFHQPRREQSRSRSRSMTRKRKTSERSTSWQRDRRDRSDSRSSSAERQTIRKMSGEEKREIVQETFGMMKGLMEDMFGKGRSQ